MRRLLMHVVRALVAASLLMLAAGAGAQMPLQMNYQVMLTDDEGNPLAEQAVNLEFRLYEQESGGSPVWSEIQNVMTNSIGVVSVVLGSVSPEVYYSFGPTWLEVEVNGEVMTPRRPLVSAPYAKVAAEAGHAFDSDELAMIPAEEYALYEVLSQTGTLNNPSNPLEWSRLKNVPSGFSDGVDDAGEGDGHSLDAVDGSPLDVVRVEADGVTRIGTGPESTYPEATLYVSGDGEHGGAIFDADGATMFHAALLGRTDDVSTIVANGGESAYDVSVPGNPAAIAGIGFQGFEGGYFSARGTGNGILCRSADTGAALECIADGTGYSGAFEGGSGVHMTRETLYPALRVENTTTSGDGDAGYFQSANGSALSTYTLYSSCYAGEAGHFSKFTDGTKYALYVSGANSASEGLYVHGYIFSTSLAARGVETSRGTEAVFGVAAENVDIMASGQGRLSDGKVRVSFGRVFSESMGDPSELRITATPVGGWSAIYVAAMDRNGFDLRSDAGDPNVEFHWVAVASDGGHERRPDVTIPDPEEDKRLERLKMEKQEASMPPARQHQGAQFITQ